MRWQHGTLYVIGEYRTVKRFLWLPIWLEEETRWLESAYIVQQRVEYVHVNDSGIPLPEPDWKNVRWSNK